MIAWDPDVTYNLSELNNTYPFFFPKNTNNTLAKVGIENLFDESLFTGFVTTVLHSNGKEIKSFDTKRKKDFLNHILKRNNKADFINFESLIEKISQIKGVN